MLGLISRFAMIPARHNLLRNISRTRNLNRSVQGIVLRRFQSSGAEAKTEPVVEVKNTEQINKKKFNDRKGNNNSKKGLKPLNRKLRDISEQIRNSVNASTDNLTESLEILEEGLSYLREVQEVEKIEEESIFSIFQPILNNILHKALDSSVSLGGKTVEDILDIYIQYNVAHQYHFTKVAARVLSAGEDPKTTYENVLKIWLKYIEYSKFSQNSLISKYYGFMRQNNINFNKYDLSHLAFYSYVQSCLVTGVNYDHKVALKLLQTDTLPEAFQIRRTITNLLLTKDLKGDFQIFSKAYATFTLENLDPNGSIITNKINEAISHNDSNLLDKTYQQMQEAAIKNNQPINENSLTKLMNGYYECKLFENVFKVFQEMIVNGIENPGINTWDLVLRSMGHPSYINQLSSEQKINNVSSIERTIETAINSGIQINPKTLSIVIGGFANSNRFDKVEEYLEKYTKDGKGTIPVIHATKNNILIGLALNKRITEAELKLKEFMEDGSNYIPSSIVMNTFLSYYAKVKNYKAVDGILQFMNKNHIPEEIGTYTIVIDIFFRMHREKGLTPNIEQLLASLNRSDSGFLNEYTFTTLIDGLVKDGTNVEAARILFDYASKKFRNSPQLLTSMLKGELDYGLISNAEIIFGKYIKTVRNDARIWNMMIKSLLFSHEDLAIQYYNNFVEQSKLNVRVSPNYYTYYFLLSHFVKRNNKEKIQFFIDELENKKINELGFELPRMLRSLSKTYKLSDNLLAQISK